MSLKETTVSSDRPIETGKSDDYELICRIGSGRYGEVFQAFNVTNNRMVAIKVLKPVRPEKVYREVNILKALSDGHNIIKLKDFIIKNGIPSLVFPFISNDTLRNLGPEFTDYEIRYYLLKLLRAIDFTHSRVLFGLFLWQLFHFVLRFRISFIAISNHQMW